MPEGSLHLLSDPHDYMCNCSLADGALDCGMTQRLPEGFCFSLVRACAWHGAPDSPDKSPHLTFVLPQECQYLRFTPDYNKGTMLLI